MPDAREQRLPPPPPGCIHAQCRECGGRGFVWTMVGLFRTRKVAEQCGHCHGAGIYTARKATWPND